MNIFNSLGSNYDLSFVLKALFAKNKESYKEKLIKFLEEKYGGRAILLYKGRQAIELALEILKLPKDSFVAINGFTCFAVYKAIETAGYKPLCLDLSNNSGLNFSTQELSQAIKQNPKIKVVIVQNTLGFPCNIEGIAKACRENNLILIEDLAHCIGTRYKNGKEAGTIGDFVVLSFSQDKIVDAVSGGALVIRNKTITSPRRWRDKDLDSSEVDNDGTMEQRNNVGLNQQLFDRLYPLFTFIIRKTYQFGLGKLIHFILKSLNLLSKPINESFYTKYDLPNWYCSLVLNAFANLKKNLEHRKQIVNIYNSMFDKKIAYPSTLRYPIFVENRRSLIDYLKKQGIYVSDIWYDSVDESLTNAKTVSETIINLPTHMNVSEKDAENISLKINQFLRHSGNQAKPGHPESLYAFHVSADDRDSGQGTYRMFTFQARMTVLK